ARNQRRACFGQVGSARSASHRVLRSPRRRTHTRLAKHPRDRRGSSLHEALVGAGATDRIRTHLHPPVRGFSASARCRYGSGADLQGWFGHRLCDRRGFEVRADPAMGESTIYRAVKENFMKKLVAVSAALLAAALVIFQGTS